jgi:hypothetical protein
MRSILILITVATLASTVGHAAPADDGDAPYCLGSDLGITLRDALIEYQTTWCSFRDPEDWLPWTCIDYVMFYWCPPGSSTCNTLVCGDDLFVYQPACLVQVSIAGDSPQWCIDFFISRRAP